MIFNRQTINLSNDRENDYLREDVKRCLRILPNDPGYPRIASGLKWMKAESSEGRKAGEIELGMEYGRENGDKDTMNT